MWPFRPLSECCTLITDGTHYTPPPVAEGVPFLTVKDMTDNGLDLIGSSRMTRDEFERAVAGNSAPRQGDVLFSKDGTVGKVHIVGAEGEFAVLSSIAILSPDPSVIDSAFLGYMLRHQSVLHDALSKKTGSAIRRLVLRDLKSVKIPLPPLPEQRRIVDLLARAEGIVRLRREAEQKAAELIPALFLDMFGDPATNPKGWPVATVGDAIESADYGSSTKASDSGDGLPLIRMGNVSFEGKLDLTDLKFVELPPTEVDRYRLREGDILFNRTNSKELVGKTGLWRGAMDAVSASYFIRLRVRRDCLVPHYLWAFMNSAHMKRVLFETARGAIGQANINSKELKAFRLPLPPAELQRHFETHCGNIAAMDEQQSAATEKAQETFDALLGQVFSAKDQESDACQTRLT